MQDSVALEAEVSEELGAGCQPVPSREEVGTVAHGMDCRCVGFCVLEKNTALAGRPK